MSTRFLAILLAAVLTAAGVLALTGERPSTTATEAQAKPSAFVHPVSAADAADNNDAFLSDFKSGYADGFNAGVSGFSYPDESAFSNNSRGYLDGYSQGYTDGQGQQATLRSQLCRTAGEAAYTATPSVYSGSQFNGSRRAAPSRVLGSRVSDDYYYTPREESRGIGNTARKALLIAGGAATGAGVGAAVGGKKGAIIGALVGGGTGTALAVTKKPSRAFNRRVSKKSVLTKTLIGAGTGAAIGALAGGKKGALAGAALGGGGGALWSLMTGKKSGTRRRR